MIDMQYINDLEAEMDVMKLVGNYNEIKSILQQYPQEQWSYEMILAFARALNYLQDYSDQTNPFEQAYRLLQTVSDKGITDAEWHLIMASVSFNLQLYAEAVKHAEQANTITAGCADDSTHNMTSRTLLITFMFNYRSNPCFHREGNRIKRDT